MPTSLMPSLALRAPAPIRAPSKKKPSAKQAAVLARRALLARFYEGPLTVPPDFPLTGWRNVPLPPGPGHLALQVCVEANSWEALRRIYFQARFTPAGQHGEITLYFFLMQKRRGDQVSVDDFEDACEGYSSASFPDYAAELFLDNSLFSTTALFDAGGILEFVLLVAPPGLNKASAWQAAADRVLREITRRYRPALLLLKAYPMELTLDRDAAWGPSREAALKRLYTRTLGVTDLNLDGFMWKPLRTKGPIQLWDEYAGYVTWQALEAETAEESAAIPKHQVICVQDSRED